MGSHPKTEVNISPSPDPLSKKSHALIPHFGMLSVDRSLSSRFLSNDLQSENINTPEVKPGLSHQSTLMCIVLVTRTKKYSIILSNRDEFLARPTVRATWWPSPHEFVLSGRDLARPAHGTWLGMTRQGRIAILTNYKEDTEEGAGAAAVSRGEITKEFLLSDKPVDEWVLEVLSTGVYKNVGGFSLMCGVLRKDTRGYAIVTNRSSVEKGADYVLSKEDEVLEYECEGLSNSLIHDEWPKVKMGKVLLQKLKEGDIQDENSFIEQCFELLSYGHLRGC